METYATVLTYAIPGFVALIIIESIAAKIMGVKINRPMDVISSLSSGMTNTLKSLIGLSVVIISYGWMVDQFGIFEIKSTFWLYVIAFIGLDFAGYWSHRFNHVVNVFWNRHIVHHSSEEFNLSCALRQTISAIVGIYFFLYIPLAIIGVPANVVAIVAPIHLFSQFWYHTRLINKMGWLEYIIVTPSHHRVHHAINPEYLDKNFSEIFIIWDKLFGTFQPELEDVTPVYGTKRPSNTWNPVIINFMHIWTIAKDAWFTKNWLDKIRVWFMPTGWRPNDVKERFPISSIQDPYSQVKYTSNPTQGLLIWSWVQLVVNNLLMYYIMTKIADFEFVDILWYAGFLMVSIFAYTSLMDWHWVALPAEVVKVVLGIYLWYRMGDWYLMDTVVPGATQVVVIYFVISLLVTAWFVQIGKGRNKLAMKSIALE